MFLELLCNNTIFSFECEKQINNKGFTILSSRVTSTHKVMRNRTKTDRKDNPFTKLRTFDNFFCTKYLSRPHSIYFYL